MPDEARAAGREGDGAPWRYGFDGAKPTADAEYGYRLHLNADEDDRGGTTAWVVWHIPSRTADSDWFTACDAVARVLELEEARRG